MMTIHSKIFVQTYGEDFNNSFISDLVFSFIQCGINWETTQNLSSILTNDNGGLELSNELAGLISQNWIGMEQLMFVRFFNTHLGDGLVFESSKGEAQSGESVSDLSKELSGGLELKAV
jgi:hypothetical protein